MSKIWDTGIGCRNIRFVVCVLRFSIPPVLKTESWVGYELSIGNEVEILGENVSLDGIKRNSVSFFKTAYRVELRLSFCNKEKTLLICILDLSKVIYTVLLPKKQLRSLQSNSITTS